MKSSEQKRVLLEQRGLVSTEVKSSQISAWVLSCSVVSDSGL